MELAHKKQILKNITQNLSVLCVEDEEDARKAIVTMLSRYFGKVMEAENGEVGISLHKEHQFDVIISDLAMPVMNGLVMVHAIKMRHPEQKIIILSGYNEEDYIRVLSNIGISDILLKPLDTNALVDVLIKIL